MLLMNIVTGKGTIEKERSIPQNLVDYFDGYYLF
jgi:hypothetical protein